MQCALTSLDGLIRLAAGAALLAWRSRGCDQPAPPAVAPPTRTAAPDATPPADTLRPRRGTRAPQPAPDAPPPTEPRPSEADGVEGARARVHARGDAQRQDERRRRPALQLRRRGRCRISPSTLHLAAVPRVAGHESARQRARKSTGCRSRPAPLNVQKASASGVYRQQFSVTAAHGARTNIARAGHHGHAPRARASATSRFPLDRAEQMLRNRIR